MNWAKIIAFLVIGANAAGAQTQSPPQTARQAVLEMLFSKDPKAVQKHIPENARKIFTETDSGLLNMLSAQLSMFQREAVNNRGHIETFDAGPLLFTSENPESVRPQRIEIVVDRDDLSGDEDQIELSLRTYKNGILDHLPVVPSLILDMKQEKDIWRLGQITLAIHVPLSDPDYVKGIADEMHKTRQRMVEFGYVDIFRREPKIARQHQRRPTINGDLQLRSGVDRRASNPVKGVEERVAVKGCTHRACLMKSPRPASASSG